MTMLIALMLAAPATAAPGSAALTDSSFSSAGDNWQVYGRGVLFLDRFTRDDARAGRHPFESIRWASGPRADRMPMRDAAKLPRALQTSIACDAANGVKLAKCRVQEVQPDTPAIREFVLGLSRELRADPAQMRARAGNIRFLSLDLKIENRAGIDGPSPCIPAFCIIHHDWNAVLPPPPRRSETGQ